MNTPAAAYAREKANCFSGIAHYQPPGGKSSIDFANGTGSTSQQNNPWQTSSRAASASTDLSYHLQLSRATGTPPTAGRRTASPLTPGTRMYPGQAGSMLNAQQFSPTPRSGSSGGSYTAPYGDNFQASSRMASPAGLYGQQQQQQYQPSYAAAPMNGEHYGSYGGYGSGGTAMPSGGSISGAVPGGWADAASGAGSSIASSYNSTSGQHGRYSMQMQQMMAQQQQQQQQMYMTSGIGSRNSSANMRAASNVMDAGSRDGGMQHDGQQGPCWSPRTGLAAGSACDAYDAAAGSAGGSRMASSSGYSQLQSNWRQEGSAWNPGAGSLEAAAAGDNRRDGYPPAAACGYGSSVPKPFGVAAFSSSKGAFGGKTIVQPPGGRTSFNIFGGA